MASSDPSDRKIDGTIDRNVGGKIDSKLGGIFSALKVLAGLALLVAMSWEVLDGDRFHFSHTYLSVQLAACTIFLLDFLLCWALAERKGYYFVHHLFYLFISIPYLNIMSCFGAEITRSFGLLVGVVPLLRAFMAFYIIVQWLVGDRVKRLFAAYLFTVVVFTYLSALVFYDCEILVNSRLRGFGDALWWAWMNVTTVGAEIFAVTTVGKIVTVLLPSLGMMMFPIFTTYILQEYSRRKKPDE